MIYIVMVMRMMSYTVGCLERSITCKYSPDLSIWRRHKQRHLQSQGDPLLKGTQPPANSTSSSLSGEGEGSSLFVSMELNGLTYQGILFQKGPSASQSPYNSQRYLLLLPLPVMFLKSQEKSGGDFNTGQQRYLCHTRFVENLGASSTRPHPSPYSYWGTHQNEKGRHPVIKMGRL